jgi:hypothetical protein
MERDAIAFAVEDDRAKQQIAATFSQRRARTLLAAGQTAVLQLNKSQDAG